MLDFDKALAAVTNDRDWNIEYEDELQRQHLEALAAEKRRIVEALREVLADEAKQYDYSEWHEGCMAGLRRALETAAGGS